MDISRNIRRVRISYNDVKQHRSIPEWSKRPQTWDLFPSGPPSNPAVVKFSDTVRPRDLLSQEANPPWPMICSSPLRCSYLVSRMLPLATYVDG